MSINKRRQIVLGSMAAVAAGALPLRSARAQKKYGPGVSDTEIKIGQTIAYSGPASAYGQIGKAEAAYFKFLNEKGGINGRKINFISIDDGYSPPKAVENVRRLVEQDEVALIFNVLGTPLNKAIRTYVNAKKVPHLFNAAGSEQFADPAKFPWTIGWQPTLRSEALFYAKALLASRPNAKVGVLYQDDDFGKEMLEGLKEGLGAKAATMVVGAQSYQPTDPTMDSQLVSLKGAGADTLFLFAYSKQVAQSIRKVAEMGWKPDTYIHMGSSQIGSTLTPAGLENSIGVKTGQFIKDPGDAQWANDPFMKSWMEWMKKNMPDANIHDSMNLAGYAYAQTLEQVLRQCGDDLTRENIIKQTASLKDYRNDALLPGSLINTSPTDYRVIEHIKLVKFNGKAWE